MTTLPIPDLRFESTFRRQLNAKAQRDAHALSTQLDLSDTEEEDEIEPAITWQTVASVVLKDIIVMPLIQGVIYTGALMLVKPWLSAMTRFAYNAAVTLITNFKRAVRYTPASGY